MSGDSLSHTAHFQCWMSDSSVDVKCIRLTLSYRFLKIHHILCVLCLSAAYAKALEDAVAALKEISFDVDITDREFLLAYMISFQNVVALPILKLKIHGDVNWNS